MTVAESTSPPPPAPAKQWLSILFLAGMSCVGAGNVCLLIFLAVGAQRDYEDDDLLLLRLKMLAMPYVLQCTWRSFFVSDFIFQKTTTNSALNSVPLARALAALGETCFVVEIVAFYSSAAPASVDTTTLLASSVILLLNGIAQAASTWAFVTKDMRCFVVEAVCWLCIFVALAVWNSILCCCSTAGPAAQVQFFAASTLVFSGASIYVQMIYLPLTVTDLALNNKIFLLGNASSSFQKKLRYAMSFSWVTKDFALWYSDICWMAPSFTLGPLVAVFLAF